MPHQHDRQRTDYDDAASILRGLKDRVEQLEETNRGGANDVQLSRVVADTTTCTDSVSVTEGTASGFTFGTSEWDFDEFGQTQ